MCAVNFAQETKKSLDVWELQFRERTTAGILIRLPNLLHSRHLFQHPSRLPIRLKLLRIFLPMYQLLNLLLSLQMFLLRM